MAHPGLVKPEWNSLTLGIFEEDFWIFVSDTEKSIVVLHIYIPWAVNWFLWDQFGWCTATDGAKTAKINCRVISMYSGLCQAQAPRIRLRRRNGTESGHMPYVYINYCKLCFRGCVHSLHEHHAWNILFLRRDATGGVECTPVCPLHVAAERPWDLQIKAAESWVSSTQSESYFKKEL